MRLIRKWVGISLVVLLIMQTVLMPGMVWAGDSAVEEEDAPTESVAEPPEAQPKADPLLDPAPVRVSAPKSVNTTEIPRYLVDFYSYDGTRIASQYVEEGQAAVQPRPPDREGYAFAGWQPSVDCVTSDMDTTATYKKLKTHTVVVNYYFKDSGEPVAKAIEEFYMAGEAVNQLYKPVEILGYAPEIPSFALETNGIDRDYIFDFVYVANSDTTYTVEYWFEKLDGTSAADPTLTRRLTGGTGAVVKAPLLPEDQSVGFSVRFVGEGRIAADGSTVLQVQYERQRFVLTFETDEGGTYLQPLVLKYGEYIFLPNNPKRDGYTFTGWLTMPSGEAFAPGVMPASDMTLQAQWRAETVSYLLVYWLEKTNIAGDPGTDPENYAFNRQETRQALAGSALSLQAGDVGAINYAKFGHGEQNVVVKGNGSTVVNVYFKRIVYTVNFSLNTNDPNITMTLNGQRYTIRDPYLIQVKHQQDIGGIWPSLKNTVFNSYFRGWKVPFSENWVTHRFIFTDDMIPPTGTSFTINAIWDSNTSLARADYWLEALPGDTGKQYVYKGVTYTLSAYDSQDFALLNGSTLNYKDINGMAEGQKPPELQFRKGGAYIGDYSTTNQDNYNSEFNFFYLRLRYTLSFNTTGGISAPSSVTVPFGAALSAHDPGWNAATVYTDLTGVTYSFVGWYQDATYRTPFSFTGAMPNRNMTLFAKWAPQAFTVIFMDGETELARQTVDGGSLIEQYTPVREGYVFMGWAKDPEGTQLFSYAERIYRDTVLYAVWNAGYTNYTVRYLLGGPGGEPVEGHADKEVRSVHVGSTATEPAAAIPSYFPDSISKSLTLQADPAKNIIEFYYTPLPEVAYTVRYVDAATGEEIPGAPEKHATTSSARIVENYLPIAGFAPRLYQISAWLSADVSQNVLVFLYDANEPGRYTVQHMIQIGVRGDGSPIYRQYGETEMKTGAIGAMTQADPLDLGPKYVFVGGNEPQLIRPDSQIHMILYYDALCTVAFVATEGGHLTGADYFGDIPAGVFFNAITAPTPVAEEGYVFAGWDRPFPERIEQDWLFTARFEPIHELAIKAGSATKVYDGAPLTNETYTYNQSALFEGHTLRIYTSGSITLVGKTNNVLTEPSILDQEGNDVTGMYRITLEDGELEVTPANISLVITAASDAKPYDGAPLVNPGYDFDEAALVPGDVLQAVVTGSVTAPGNAPNTVDSWTVVNGQGEDVSVNYIVHTVDGLLTVTPMEDELVVTAASATKQYDGAPLTDASFAYDQSLLAAGHTLAAVVEGSITEVGTAENRVVSWQIIDANETDVSANYRVATVDGLLTVLPVQAPILVIAANDQKVYDGTPLTNPNFTYDQRLLIAGHKVEAQVQGSITDVGEADNHIESAKVVDAEGKDVTINYILRTQDGLLTVLPPQRVLVITAASDSKTYDGTLLTNPNYTFDSDLLMAGHELTAEVAGSIINVGTADNVIKMWRITDASGNDVSANYRVSAINGLLTILPKEAMLIRADSAVKFFDGTPLTDPIYFYDETLLAEGDELTAVVEGSIVDVGSEKNIITSYRITNASGDVTQDYTIVTVDGTLTVLPKETPLVITAASAQKVYDGTPLSDATYTFDASLLSEGHVLIATVMGSITKVGKRPNVVTEWRIVDQDGQDVTFDYTVQTVNGTLTILPGDGGEGTVDPPTPPEPPTPRVGDPGEQKTTGIMPPHNAGHNMQ